jgi:hypothetical protein
VSGLDRMVTLRTIVVAAAIVGIVMLCRPASAYDANDSNNCNGAAWNDEHAMVVAKVTARPRVNFVKSPYDDDFKAERCPAATASCRKKSFLVPGDLVLVGETRGDFTCVDHVVPRGKTRSWTSGWLPSAALTPVAPTPSPRATDWIGTWVPGARIEITDSGEGKLHIDAVRVIESAGGNTQNGTFRATVMPGTSTLAFADEGTSECRLRMQRIGPWLLVEDNGGCGGAGVSFLGLYRRK